MRLYGLGSRIRTCGLIESVLLSCEEGNAHHAHSRQTDLPQELGAVVAPERL